MNPTLALALIISSRRTLRGVAALSLALAAVGVAAQDPAPPGKVKAAVAKAKAAVARVTGKQPAKKAEPAPDPLPPAPGEQIAAASLAYFGNYNCEFAQTVEVGLNPKHEGYLDVKFGKLAWIMKPVLSSTGALRLEDIKGRILMLQIANKSMLMDTVAGRRLVDDCLHEKQRDFLQAAAAAASAASAPQ